MLIRTGSRGNGVVLVQHALNAVTTFTPKLKPDGIFGRMTEQRVKQHQSRNGLIVDGIVGPATLSTLFEIARMKAVASFRRRTGAERSTPGLPPRPRLALNNSAPPPPNLLPPAMADFLRHQRAFWEWWASPAPKPPLPVQAVVVPMPGPFGPVYLPVLHRQVTVQGPPLRTTSRIQFESPPEGGAFTLSISGDASVDVAKMKFKEAGYSIALDWAVFKGRVAEVAVSPSIQRADDGQMQVTVEASITGGSGLTLKKKLGQLGVIKALPYLATAITSDASIEASAGAKAAVEINLSPNGGTKVTLTGKAGPKAIFGPVTGPDGREHHQFTGLPFAASLSLSFEGEFDFP